MCVNCGAEFIRSFLTFDHLPLVEFQLEDSLQPAEAMAIIGENLVGDFGNMQSFVHVDCRPYIVT